MSCGLEGHFRSECPTGSPESRGSREASGLVPPGVGGVPKGPPAPKAKAVPQVKGVQEDVMGGVGPEVAQAGGSSITSEALIAEAAKLLKGVSLKPIRVQDEGFPKNVAYPRDLGIDQGWLMSAMSSVSDPLFALVDSGATNALRPAEEGEISRAREICVDLASGTTKLHVNEYGTLLSTGSCQVILPACYLVQLGFIITWKKKSCAIRRKGEVALPVKVVKGCPLIPKEKGLQLLKEYEDLRKRGDLPILQAVREPVVEPIGAEDPRVWLARKVGAGTLSRQDQIRWFVSMFPEVPYDYACEAAGCDADPGCMSAEGTPWNRRKRRSVLRAQAGEVLLHLFSGRQKWRCPGQVIEVEKSMCLDLMSPGVFQHVLCWGIKGVIGGVVGGPPCRSVSRCRSATDGGPPPVRDRQVYRWGLATLTAHWKRVVREDSVLWLRFLLAYAVAQAAADAPRLRIRQGRVDDSLTLPSARVWPEAISIPRGVTNPMDLARWALSEAAKRVRVTGDVYSLPKEALQPIFFVWEHPADPELYLREELRPPGGWPSWWAFPEWRCFSKAYDLHLARLDQGKYGHARPKPTQLATSSWFLYERLHGQVLSVEEAKWFKEGPVSMEQRVSESPGWAKWAPGLTRHILDAWVHWGMEQGLWSEVKARRLYVAKLTEEEQQRRHAAQDHVPFRKGCPVCIGAQSRQRSHWRASVKSLYSASFDIAGPFKAGRSFDATASGRDKGGGYKYFLACAFTVPLLKPGRSDSEVDPEESEPLVPAPDIPDMAELFPEEEEGQLSLEPVEEVLERAVHFRVRGKHPEGPELEQCAGPVEPEPPLPPPAVAPSAASDPPVVTRMLCIGAPLRSKKGREVCAAVQAMVNRLEAFGFPVHRYHADRAQELKSKQLVAWLRDKGVHTTWTPGDTPAGNRAEVAVQQLQSRKLLLAAALPVEFWPLALLHASNRHWMGLARDLGITQPVLLPFGLGLHARKRQTTGYGSHWVTRTLSGKYLGQAPSTPGGHLVLVGQAEGEPKLLLTNTVYPIRGATAAKPKFRIKGKMSPELLLRTLSAWHFPSLAVAKQSPGGGCAGEEGEDEAALFKFWPVNVRTGTTNAPAWLQTCEMEDEPSGLQALEEDVAPNGQQILGESSAPVRQDSGLRQRESEVKAILGGLTFQRRDGIIYGTGMLTWGVAGAS